MSEAMTIDELQERLNLAFSVNYLVLDNFRHIDPMNHQGVFYSADVFAPKTYQQKTYEGLYKDYANQRNMCFSKLQKYFDSYGYENAFAQNTRFLISFFNDLTNQNINYSDVFTSKEIKDMSFLEKMADEIDDNASLSLMDRASIYMVFQDFMFFYANYQKWLTVSEIFDTLREDITEHGSKSARFGKPSNKNVFTVDKDSYEAFMTPILMFAKEKEQILENQRIHLIKKIKSGNTDLEQDLQLVLTQQIALKLIFTNNDMMNKRFKSASKKPEPKSKIFAFLDDFVSRIIFSETKFKVDRVYLHKYEILEFANAISIFPELQENASQLKKLALGSEQDLSNLNPAQQENT